MAKKIREQNGKEEEENEINKDHNAYLCSELDVGAVISFLYHFHENIMQI